MGKMEVHYPEEFCKIPPGGIIIWSGAANAIPEGWALCDGRNGTPDLRDRFVVGAGSTYSVGAKGGEKTHKLSVNEMPRHTHNAVYGSNQGGNGAQFAWGEGTMPAPLLVQYTGGDQPHNNLPPYYALCYIMLL